MKKILIIAFFFCLRNANAQLCVQADCKDSIRLPQDSILLNSVVTAPTLTTTIWRLLSGSGTLTNSTTTTPTAHNLLVGVNVFQVTAQTSNLTATALDTVVVFPACKVYTAADTAAIQALKICPKTDSAGIINAYLLAHPCPVIPPQRTVTGIVWDIILNKKVITYNDGSTSTL